MSVAEYRPNLSRGYCSFHTYNKMLYTSISCMYVYFYTYIYIMYLKCADTGKADVPAMKLVGALDLA